MTEGAPAPERGGGNPAPPESPALDRTEDALGSAGLLLILNAIATVVAVVGRVGADTDLPTPAASLAAVAENRGLYGTGGAGRLASGVTLIAAAWYLHPGRAAAGTRAAPIVCILFAASGLLTAYSGAAAVVLAAIAPDGQAAAPAGEAARQLAATATLRQFSGAVGFAAAGLALIVSGRDQWRAGGELSRTAAVSMLLGLTMQFIWLDAATLMHQITGIVFVVWLALVGAKLRRGRSWLPA